ERSNSCVRLLPTTVGCRSRCVTVVFLVTVISVPDTSDIWCFSLAATYFRQSYGFLPLTLIVGSVCADWSCCCGADGASPVCCARASGVNRANDKAKGRAAGRKGCIEFP